MNDTLDEIETAIAYLLCAKPQLQNATELNRPPQHQIKGESGVLTVQAGATLGVEPMVPSDSYIAEPGADRIFAQDARLLLQPVQDLIGRSAEAVMLLPDRAVWIGARAIKRAPRRVWVASPRASLFEVHISTITALGATSSSVHIAAMDSAGAPVRTVIMGGSATMQPWYGEQVVILASIIEDAHRPGTLLSRVTDEKSVRLPVPIGEHREIFALREAPLNRAGKRKAIIHWVRSHTRRTARGEANVSEHWRGARSIEIEGMRVELTPN